MWSIIGHAPAMEALERALSSDRPAHAWLFSGPEGVGKRTAAIEFAAALNCTGGSRPCGECRACRDTLGLKHADVEIVAPGGLCDEPDHREHTESRDLRICQIRRLERVLSLSPYAGGRRIAIVDAADTLRTEAANAFLKTLEEPPDGSVIILLVERDERLPETVASRCQRVVFRPVERAVIVQALIAKGAEQQRANAIAAAAAGRLGWALAAFDDAGVLAEREQVLDEAMRVAHAGRYERFSWAVDAANRAGDVRERYIRTLQVWEGWWRDVLLYSSGATEGALNSDRSEALAREGKMYGTADVANFLASLIKTREYLHENVDPQLALENLTLDLPEPIGNR
jgi:DNA polymerase III subunit delta'